MSAKSGGRPALSGLSLRNISQVLATTGAKPHASGSKRLSTLEETLAVQILALKLPPAVREYRFDTERRWRFDFAWPDVHLAVEVEGAVWTGGRHTRGKGFTADCKKYNRAAMLGWSVLRATGDMVKSGEAIGLIESALSHKKHLSEP